MKSPDWSKGEIALLKKHYAETSNADLAVMLGRSALGVASKAKKLKLHKGGELIKRTRFKAPVKAVEPVPKRFRRITRTRPAPGVIITTHRLQG